MDKMFIYRLVIVIIALFLTDATAIAHLYNKQDDQIISIVSKSKKRFTLSKGIPLNEQLVYDHSVYVVKYDFTLTEDISIPYDCVLEFTEGSISGLYSLIGQNTQIKSNKKKIFSADVNLVGTWVTDNVYPEWFGAEGNGVTDDCISIQKSIDFASISGGNVIFSNKTYGIGPSTPFKGLLPRSNVDFVGYKTKFLILQSDANIISNIIPYRQGDYTEISNIKISDIEFDSNGSLLGDPSNDERSFGIYILYGKNVSVSNCKFRNSYYGGFNFQRCRGGIKVYDCYFDNIGKYIDASIGKNYAAMGADGTPYDTHVTDSIIIEKCTVTNCGAVFRINGGYNTGSSGIHKNIIINQCHFSNCYSGIYTLNLGMLDEVIISNNLFENIFTRVIFLVASPQIMGYRISAVDNVKILNNVVHNKFGFNPQNRAFIFTLDVVSKAIISGCTYIQENCDINNRAGFLKIVNTKINAKSNGKPIVTICNNTVKVADELYKFVYPETEIITNIENNKIITEIFNQ